MNIVLLTIVALLELAAVTAVVMRWYVKAHSKPQLTDEEIEEMRTDAVQRRSSSSIVDSAPFDALATLE
jgi:hypothetical protein